MNNLFKNLAIWLVIGVVLMTVFNQFNNRQAAQNSVEYSQFMEDAKQGKIAKAIVDGRTVRATTQDGRQVTVYTPGVQDIWMVGDLMRYGVKVTAAKPEEEQSFLMNIFVSWFPMILLIGVWAADAGRWARRCVLFWQVEGKDARRVGQYGHLRRRGGL